MGIFSTGDIYNKGLYASNSLYTADFLGGFGPVFSARHAFLYAQSGWFRVISAV